MSNSRNYELFESPYAKSLAQYPSQSEEYIPFELKGLDTSVHKNRQTPNITDRYTSTPSKNERGSVTSCRLSFGEGNGSFYPHKQQNRKRNISRNRTYGCRLNGGNDNNLRDNHRLFDNSQYQSSKYNTPRQQIKDLRKDFESYFHPSMLEDPWKELMERYNAIRNSQINIQTEKDDEKLFDKNYGSTESSNASSEEEMQD